MASLLASQAISPLRALAYPLASVASALRALAQASHVGKVVSYAPPAPVTSPTPGGTSGVTRARVLVTGGTGGLGLLVARWLSGCASVGHIHLASRTGRTAAEVETGKSTSSAVQHQQHQQQQREGGGDGLWELLSGACGASVTVEAADMSCSEDAAVLLQAWSKDGGHGACWDAVVHASGVLADGMLGKQSLAGLRKVRLPAGTECAPAIQST